MSHHTLRDKLDESWLKCTT